MAPCAVFTVRRPFSFVGHVTVTRRAKFIDTITSVAREDWPS